MYVSYPVVTGGAAQGFFIAGTVVAMAAGGLHVVYALVDTVRPTYFAPVDEAVEPAMEETTIRLTSSVPVGQTPSMWSVWLGIHIGFGMGLFTFGLLCLLVAIHDFTLVESIAAIRPVTIGFSALFLAVALRFFFYGPVLITGAATACFTVATVLSA